MGYVELKAEMTYSIRALFIRVEDFCFKPKLVTTLVASDPYQNDHVMQIVVGSGIAFIVQCT